MVHVYQNAIPRQGMDMAIAHKQPQYLSQEVDFLGFLAKQIGDLQGITTLAHELIQNADDAKNDSGKRCAREIIFDVTDEALLVSNDAPFRNEDFGRMQNIADGGKRFEGGERTTGAFGIGFISVYQITDRPEVVSAGRRWILHPDHPGERRIEVHDESNTQGALFRLPWAFQESSVRRKLRVSPVRRESIDSFVKELEKALPHSILFLKSLEKIELRRNGIIQFVVQRVRKGSQLRVKSNGSLETWWILEGSFPTQAQELKNKPDSRIEGNRIETVQVAVPNFQLNSGVLYATLPTEQNTGLPFHINADFFPDSDRKSIVFGTDYRSEWNRVAIAASANLLAVHMEKVLECFQSDPRTFWFILQRIQQTYHEVRDDIRRPFGHFWPAVTGCLKHLSVVYTETKQWCSPAEVRIPISTTEEVVSVFLALGIKTVHNDLRSYYNILTSDDVGVQPVRPKDLLEAFKRMGLAEHPIPLNVLPKGYRSREGLGLIWNSLISVLEKYTGQDKNTVLSEIADCALAPCQDGQLWPFASVYRSDHPIIKKLFEAILPNVRFLVDFGDHKLAEWLCPSFGPEEAIDALSLRSADELNADYQKGIFEPVRLLRWFEERKHLPWFSNTEIKQRLAALPIFPSGGRLRPLSQLVLPGNFSDPIGLSGLVDIEKLPRLRDFLEDLGAKTLTFTEYARTYIPGGFTEKQLDVEARRRLIELLARHIGEIREEHSIKRLLVDSPIIECDDGLFRQPNQVYRRSAETEQIFASLVPFARPPKKHRESIEALYDWLGVAENPKPHDIIDVIKKISGSCMPGPKARERVGKILELGPAMAIQG